MATLVLEELILFIRIWHDIIKNVMVWVHVDLWKLLIFKSLHVSNMVNALIPYHILFFKIFFLMFH